MTAGHNDEIAALLVQLDPSRREAFGPHRMAAVRLFGAHDGGLAERRVHGTWPKLGSAI